MKTDLQFMNFNSNGSINVEYILNFKRGENVTVEKAAEVLKESVNKTGKIGEFGVDSNSTNVYGEV